MTTAKPAAKKAAKPAIDRAAIVGKVCARMEEGESLRKSCEAEGVKDPTFLDWVKADESFAEQYARAREAGLHCMAQQIIEISDEQEIEARYNGEDMKLEMSSVAVQRNKLRVDSRKWLLSKMLPKVYGEKLAIGGADDLPAVAVATFDASKLPIEMLEAIMKVKDDAK
jgi:hypothetical protein